MKRNPPHPAEGYAQTRGSPGTHPRLTGLLRIILPLFVVVGIAGYLVRAAWPKPDMGPSFVGFLFLLLAMALAVAVGTSRRRLDAFLKGARGEEWVARMLALLPSEYTVFNGLIPPGRRSAADDYDHVVVGPTGVFLIETKNWSGLISLEEGRILYNGNVPDRPPLAQVERAASTLRDALRDACDSPVEVQPVLCFAGSRMAGGCAGTGGTIVCDMRTLHDVILKSSSPGPADTHRAKVEAALSAMIL